MAVLATLDLGQRNTLDGYCDSLELLSSVILQHSGHDTTASVNADIAQIRAYQTAERDDYAGDAAELAMSELEDIAFEHGIIAYADGESGMYVIEESGDN